VKGLYKNRNLFCILERYGYRVGEERVSEREREILSERKSEREEARRECMILCK
jgi:hypothetical protein